MCHFLKVIIGFLLLCFSSASLAQQANPVASYTLPNGLQLFVQEDHRAPVVISQVWYKVGSSYEPLGITGISHALEHMMFKGTALHGPGEFSRIIAENGGQQNAMTGTDYTVYYQELAADKLPISFELEADRMRNLNISAEEFAKEIQVVMEERRMRFEDNPQALTYERFIAAAYLSSPYHHLPIGWMNDIKQLTAEDLRAWYQKWYAPNNAFIVVVGDVKPEQVYQLALKYFGALKPSELPKLKTVAEVPSIGVRDVVVKAPAQLPIVMMGYNVPSVASDRQSKDPYVLAVIAAILSSGDNSWFNKNLIRGQQIASAADVEYDLYARYNTLFTISGIPAEGHTVEELKTALVGQIKKLQDTLVDAQELQRIKVGVIADKIYSKDAIDNQAMEIGALEAVNLPWQMRDEFIKRISAITPEQVQAVAQKYFTESNLTRGELQPLPLAPGQKVVAPASPLGEKNVH